MNAKPAVSAIIVNWNGARHLRTCLPSLLSQSFTSLEVIVVDNDSKDDSAEVAREFQVRWLPLDKNAGLAPALNRGAAMAVGDFLLFINNDMRFDPGFVAALVEPLEKNEEIFATDGMQFNWDGSERGHLAARLARCRRNRRCSRPPRRACWRADLFLRNLADSMTGCRSGMKTSRSAGARGSRSGKRFTFRPRSAGIE